MDASVLDLLKGVELFSELSDDQLKLLANLVEVQNFNRDETVVLEGDDAVQALYCSGVYDRCRRTRDHSQFLGTGGLFR